MERKCTNRQYHVQDNVDVAHKYVKMYFNTNRFPALLFCGPHSKPHGARGMSKQYQLRFDTKLGNGVCAIRRITCAVFHVHQLYINLGYLLYHQIKKSSINL